MTTQEREFDGVAVLFREPFQRRAQPRTKVKELTPVRDVVRDIPAIPPNQPTIGVRDPELTGTPGMITPDDINGPTVSHDTQIRTERGTIQVHLGGLHPHAEKRLLRDIFGDLALSANSEGYPEDPVTVPIEQHPQSVLVPSLQPSQQPGVLIVRETGYRSGSHEVVLPRQTNRQTDRTSDRTPYRPGRQDVARCSLSILMATCPNVGS